MTARDLLASPLWDLLESPVIHADCFDAMAAMPAESIDAVVCDPPYALEFMGKAWDKFRTDDPGTRRHRGERAGSHGDLRAENETNPAAGRVALGGGKRPSTYRCVGCGKRDQFRKDHACPPGTRWARESLDPFAAPPTMLAFGEWTRRWALEAMRVLKPGGHVLAFAGSRTYHRMACGLEDAGLEVRDQVVWLYGEGFPKALDVGRAIDDHLGNEREVVGYKDSGLDKGSGTTVDFGGSDGRAENGLIPVTAPASPEAELWEGWSTALKPAMEPIVLARKPLAGTVVETVLAHGTGALNTGGCRIEMSDEDAGKWEDGRRAWPMRDARADEGRRVADVYGEYGPTPLAEAPDGRWPANVLLDEEAAAMLDEQSGECPGMPLTTRRRGDSPKGYGMGFAPDPDVPGYGDTGGASRFFYVAKPTAEEREAGLERPDAGADPSSVRQRLNTHATVKPIDLMRWLVRLVTPVGGVVLDPFCGSGTTLCGAALEGVACVGVEREAEYVPIARARHAFWERERGDLDRKVLLGAEKARRRRREAGQEALFS